MKVKEFKKDGFVVELDKDENPEDVIALQCENPVPDDEDDDGEIDPTGKGFQPKAVFTFWTMKNKNNT